VDDATWTTVAQARAADAEAITALYEQYSEGLYRYLLFVSGDSELAEDLTGQAFLRWLDRANHRANPPTTVRAALYRSAHDLFMLHEQAWHRRAGERRVALDPSPMATAPSGADAPESLWEQFQLALARLSELPIQVLALKIGGSLSTVEVAWVLGCREDEIKQAQLHALVHLRQWLSGTSTAFPLEDEG
jgi:RNA polymerase sigma-70 factor (ECF subfamily)